MDKVFKQGKRKYHELELKKTQFSFYVVSQNFSELLSNKPETKQRGNLNMVKFSLTNKKTANFHGSNTIG